MAARNTAAPKKRVQTLAAKGDDSTVDARQTQMFWTCLPVSARAEAVTRRIAARRGARALEGGVRKLVRQAARSQADHCWDGNDATYDRECSAGAGQL
jgi:hypothetical protein